MGGRAAIAAAQFAGVPLVAGPDARAALGQGAVDAERARVLVPDAAFGLRVEVRAEPPKAVLPKGRIHISLFGPFSEMSIPIAAIN